MGEQVRISHVAVSQGGLTLTVTETPLASQPNPFSLGETVVVPRTASELQEERGIGFAEAGGNTSLSELVEGLNALGVRPRNMIDILKSIHVAGALHADLIIE